MVGGFGFQPPVPGVVEGGDLRGRLFAALLAKQYVVSSVGVEGRVEVDQVDAFIGDVLAQDVEVVAEVEFVIGIRNYHSWPVNPLGCVPWTGTYLLSSNRVAKAEIRPTMKVSNQLA